MRIPLLFSALLAIVMNLPGQDHFDCFSVLVGKEASADGSVMLAHNEDDWGERLVNWYKVPGSQNKAGETYTLKRGGIMERPATTWSFWWLEMPEMEFSDSYVNEWGVTIVSDACLSREDQPELTDGGIGYWLRRAMAMQARSAREAVKIGGALIEKYGYASSGRTYCIAGPREVWMLAAVNGKHWVAQRVPRNHVALIPNYYTITKVNLGDTMNYYGSSDLVQYAIKRGWYNPKTDGVFNFRLVYSDPGTLTNMGNLVRHASAVNLLSEKTYHVDDPIPFSFEPKEKVTLQDLFAILRNHNEGSPFYTWEADGLNNPHQQGRGVCANTTQYGMVVQIRSNRPKELATVMWIAPFRPCVHPFVPWYFGLNETPEGFAAGKFNTAMETHFNEITNLKEVAGNHRFLEFVNHAKAVDTAYATLAPGLIKVVTDMENKWIEREAGYEKKMISLGSRDKEAMIRSLSGYTNDKLDEVRKLIRSRK
ncbi:MAG: hypothetical protein Kow00127_22750 [Bacteroidales bacterium]